MKKQKAKKFSSRLSKLLYNSQQPSRSSHNTSGIMASFGVTNGQDIDSVVEPKRALKGKEVRYE